MSRAVWVIARREWRALISSRAYRFGTLVGALAFRYFKVSRTGQRIVLRERLTSEQGYTAPADLQRWVGRTGRALTPLRPGGVIEVDGERLDASTEGEYLEPGTPVRVVRAEGLRIVVRRLEEP